MAHNTSDSYVQKITVTVPTILLERLAEYVPARKRSDFIVQAIEERLAIEEQLAAIDEAVGAWSDEDYPHLDSGEAIEQWIQNLRASWQPAALAHVEPVPHE